MLLHDVETVNEQNIKSTIQRMLKDLSQVIPDIQQVKPPKPPEKEQTDKSPRKKGVFDQIGSLMPGLKKSKSEHDMKSK